MTPPRTKPTAREIAQRAKGNGAPPADQTVQIPDFVVRQVGTLQLLLADAQETIGRLQAELDALKATRPQ